MSRRIASGRSDYSFQFIVVTHGGFRMNIAKSSDGGMCFDAAPLMNTIRWDWSANSLFRYRNESRHEQVGCQREWRTNVGDGQVTKIVALRLGGGHDK